MTKYKVFCERHNWHLTASSMIEVKHFEQNHWKESNCLEAEHERIG